MKLKEKLTGIKETIKDYGQEMMDVTNLSAEEYAQYYGGNYTNFLKAVNTKIFKAISERNSESEETEEVEIQVEMKVSSYKKGRITFDEPEYLGAKETLEISKINFMLTKAKMSAYLDEERNVLVINSKSLGKIFEEAKDEYISAIKASFEEAGKSISEKVEGIKEKAATSYQDGKEKAGSTIKRVLKDASDWADKNL